MIVLIDADAVTGPIKQSDPITTIIQIFTIPLIIIIHFSYDYLKIYKNQNAYTENIGKEKGITGFVFSSTSNQRI
jgi:hypothetical protein